MRILSPLHHFSIARARPILRKELRLQRPTLFLAAIGLALWLALFAVSLAPDVPIAGVGTLLDLVGGLNSALWVFLMALTPVFAGICAVIPERRSGVLDWQASLPVSRRAQWAAKTAIACAIVVVAEAAFALCGAFIFARASEHDLSRIGDDILESLQRSPDGLPLGVLAALVGFASVVAAITLASAWVSTLVREALPALAAVIVFVVATVFAHAALDPFALSLSLPLFGTASTPGVGGGGSALGGAVVFGTILCGALFLLGASNWRFAPVGRLRSLGQSALWLLALACAVFATIPVRHGFPPLRRLEPIPAKGLVPLLGSSFEAERRASGHPLSPVRPLVGGVHRVPGTDRVLSAFAINPAAVHWPQWAYPSATGGQIVDADTRTGAIRFVAGRMGVLREIEPGGTGYSIQATNMGYRVGSDWFAFAERTRLGRWWNEGREPMERLEAAGDSPGAKVGRTAEFVDDRNQSVAYQDGHVMHLGPRRTRFRIAPRSRIFVFESGRSALDSRRAIVFPNAYEWDLQVEEDSGSLRTIDRWSRPIASWEDQPDQLARIHPWRVTSDDRWFVHGAPPPAVRFVPADGPLLLRATDGSREIALELSEDGFAPALARRSQSRGPFEPVAALRLGDDDRVLPVSPDGRWLVLAYSVPPYNLGGSEPAADDDDATTTTVAAGATTAGFGVLPTTPGASLEIRHSLRAVDLSTGRTLPIGDLEPTPFDGYNGVGADRFLANSEANRWHVNDTDLGSRVTGAGPYLRPAMAWSPGGGLLAVLHRDRLHFYRPPAPDAPPDTPPSEIAVVPIPETESDDLAFLDDDTLLLMGLFSIWRMDVNAALAGA